MASSRHTFYPIERSPLHAASPNKLARVLGFEKMAELQALVDDCERSYVFFKSGKRDIQQPVRRLQQVHKTLGKLLGRIEAPEYLQSGLKGTSYRKNAARHLENSGSNMFTMDIQKFFPSTSYKHIWKTFVDKFHCDGDIASVLTRVCMVHGHIPTGSSLSTILSFHGYSKMFDEIARLCAAKGVVFTCYVDDLTCSGVHANRKLASQVRRIIRRFGLTPHPEKTKYYVANQIKMVTGVAITPKGPRLPNIRRKAIHDDFIQLEGVLPDSDRIEIENRLSGRLGEASLFEDRFQNHSKFFRARLKTSRSKGKRASGE